MKGVKVLSSEFRVLSSGFRVSGLEEDMYFRFTRNLYDEKNKLQYFNIGLFSGRIYTIGAAGL